MKEKKYIDRLYQEKFRDFEVAPRDAVWNSIAAKLQEEEKKPVVFPKWSRLAGVAAILAFLLLIGDWLFSGQPAAAIANEEIQTPALPGDTSPSNTRLSIVPLKTEDEPIAEAEIISKENRQKVAREIQKIPEVAAIEVSYHKPIFDTSGPVAGKGYQNYTNTEFPQNEQDLFEELTGEETEIATTTVKNKFEISTHAAPIYYGNMGKGNFIDPRFNNNSSGGELTYSYGINMAYNLSHKFKIRSGINKVNMSYNTGGVAYQAVAGTSPVKNISLESGTTMTSTPGAITSGRKPTGSTNRNEVGFLRPGELNQKMGYLEIPLELEYNLFAKKFELNLIGGASTLFLAENEITLNSGSVSAEGRANNLNNISFSTNFGLGLDYNLSNKFKLNLEPMLKYQLNTFENSTSDTRPYYFGIYSGFSYKF